MGHLGDLEIRPRTRTPPAPRARWPWLAGGAAVLLLAAWVFRQPLADRLWPETRAQALLGEAGRALAQGRLTAADGTGARELYEAAIAIDPDAVQAREGLARVADAALSQAQAALDAQRYDQAHRALALARELDVPRSRADALAARLRTRESEAAGIDGLLVRAMQARAQGSLDGSEDAALPLYRRVLALQPQRVDALEGREDAIADLLQQARADLDAGRLAQGAARIAAARGYDAGHVDLPEAQARLARARDDTRTGAERDLRRGRLAQAAEAYRALHDIDAGDADAARGLANVAAAYAHRAERAASDFDFAAADAALREAKALAPASPALAEATRHVSRARQARARLATAPRHADPRRVRVLLQEAAAAQARGDLLTPPGDSAFDKLRAARALAPDDPGVRRASARLLPAAQRCFERELRANALARARACRDAAIALGGDAGANAAGRLAERWLAVGEERLGAGDLAGAESALRNAREVEPGLAGLGDFERRLRTASASAD